MDVYLIETYYSESEKFVELFLHIEGTDIWLTDEGYSSEQINVVGFTQKFWDSIPHEHIVTKLGPL